MSKPVTTQKVHSVLQKGGIKNSSTHAEGYTVEKVTQGYGKDADKVLRIKVGYEKESRGRSNEAREKAAAFHASKLEQMGALLYVAGIFTVVVKDHSQADILVIEGNNLFIQSAPAIEATPAPEQPQAPAAEPAPVAPYAIVCDFDADVRYLTEQQAVDLRTHLANEGAKTDTYTEVLPISEEEATRIHQTNNDIAFEWLMSENDMESSSPNAPDAFQVTPPSLVDAWEDTLVRPCSCGAYEEGYMDHGPAHAKSCRMYSEEERAFEMRARARLNKTQVRAAIANMADDYEQRDENGDYFRWHSPW